MAKNERDANFPPFLLLCSAFSAENKTFFCLKEKTSSAKRPKKATSRDYFMLFKG